MRSSKSRSRGKSNRNRPAANGGNITNRVFDSSGPEGKVRGTPQQIIDKYNQLVRDSQLSNDRVAAENFAQHAEHYTRLLADNQREIDARREVQEAQNRERQAQRDAERAERIERQEAHQAAQPAASEAPAQPAASSEGADLANAPQPDLLDAVSNNDSGLVETPEAKPRKQQNRRPRKPRAEQQADAPAGSEGEPVKRAPRPRRRKPEATEAVEATQPTSAPEPSGE
jgi:hypothetical protein